MFHELLSSLFISLFLEVGRSPLHQKIHLFADAHNILHHTRTGLFVGIYPPAIPHPSQVRTASLHICHPFAHDVCSPLFILRSDAVVHITNKVQNPSLGPLQYYIILHHPIDVQRSYSSHRSGIGFLRKAP